MSFYPDANKIYEIEYTNSRGEESTKLVSINPYFFEKYFEDKGTSNKNNASKSSQTQTQFFIELHSDKDTAPILAIKNLTLSSINILQELEIKENMLNDDFLKKYLNAKDFYDPTIDSFIYIFDEYEYELKNYQTKKEKEETMDSILKLNDGDNIKFGF